MSKTVSKQEFFQGIMMWEQSGMSFENKRISIDKENLNAFFYTFHERLDVLEHVAREFIKCGIACEIIPLSKYTKRKSGYLLETERHKDFTSEYKRWYIEEGK